MISVILPTYNETANIDRLVAEISEALRGLSFEMVFVDDSTDDTPQKILAVKKRGYPIKLAHRTGEKGLATAVLHGFSIAGGEYIAVMDADLQHPPALLREMYCAMEAGADLALPSRMIPGGDDGGLKGARKAVSAIARKIGQLMVPNARHVSDPTSGVFMLRRKILENAPLQPIGWKILMEILAVCPYRLIIEIPYRFQARFGGESKFSAAATLAYLGQLLSLRRRMRINAPITVLRWTTAQTQTALEQLVNRSHAC